MESINSDAVMQGMGNQNGGNSQMMAKAKSMGVPDEIISQGRNAIKSWAQENGKVPGGMGKGNGNGGGKGMDISTLMEQLEASGIPYEDFLAATEEGPEATKDLFEQYNFSFNTLA